MFKENRKDRLNQILNECSTAINNLLKPAIDYGYDKKVGNQTYNNLVVPCQKLLAEIDTIKKFVIQLPNSEFYNKVADDLSPEINKLHRSIQSGDLTEAQNSITKIMLAEGVPNVKQPPTNKM